MGQVMALMSALHLPLLRQRRHKGKDFREANHRDVRIADRHATEWIG